jgi:predicted NUDIX family phosphoesterase
MILSWIEQHVQEDILSIEKSIVSDKFKGTEHLTAQETRPLISAFAKYGEYRPRSQVENDAGRVQALPVVVVRNHSGDVLQLRRKEKKEENPLHEKVVIWAGGHVRKEDDKDGDSLLSCAIRELQEELRLSTDSSKLRLIGSVYSDQGERTSKHIAVVYEWKAETDDVSVALSGSEFFERQGNSLSGSFVGLEELAHDVDLGKLSEPWSAQIVRNLLAPHYKYAPSLFDRRG